MISLHLLRDVSLDELRSLEFERLTMMMDHGRQSCTTNDMAFVVKVHDAAVFHNLFMKFKRPDIKVRRFYRGPRTHRARATSSLKANAHSVAYYVR